MEKIDSKKEVKEETLDSILNILRINLAEAIDDFDEEKAQLILKKIFSHKVKMLSIKDVNEAEAGVNLTHSNIKDTPDKRVALENQLKNIEEIKLNINKFEINTEQMKKIEKELAPFMNESFLMWYGKKNEKGLPIPIEANTSIQSSISILNEIKEKENPSNFGKYSTNPDISGTDYIEKMEIPKTEILEMKELVGKPRLEVMKVVIERYIKTHRIPDLLDMKYFLSKTNFTDEDSPYYFDSIIKENEDEENLYYFMGSIFCGPDGGYNIPCVDGYERLFHQSAGHINDKWTQHDRVLLLKK